VEIGRERLTETPQGATAFRQGKKGLGHGIHQSPRRRMIRSLCCPKSWRCGPR
jgi:hypothetical protein